VEHHSGNGLVRARFASLARCDGEVPIRLRVRHPVTNEYATAKVISKTYAVGCCLPAARACSNKQV
jgi:hypothetical protein